MDEKRIEMIETERVTRIMRSRKKEKQKVHESNIERTFRTGDVRAGA